MNILSVLEADVSYDEIHTALFSMNGDKSPNHNGFTAHFFKSSWSIVKSDFINAVKSFFYSSRMSREINSTISTLVPKKGQGG